MSRPMPLRQLLTHTEKCSRDLADQVKNFVAQRLAELHDLSRPVRKRSSYPKMQVVSNCLAKAVAAAREGALLAENLEERLQEIHRHAVRELDRRYSGYR